MDQGSWRASADRGRADLRCVRDAAVRSRGRTERLLGCPRGHGGGDCGAVVKRKLLLVDDSALARRSMRALLEANDFNVIEADDGLVALETYFTEKPDVVMLDLVMKGMYGLDVLAKLREMDPGARVIVVSADVQSSSQAMAIEA